MAMRNIFFTWFCITLALFVSSSYCLDNGLGRTPQMGWNSWNHFKCNINEEIIRQTADAIVKTGLKDAGYEYVNIDDCWAVNRTESGEIVPDPVAFPSGMKALADYVHSKGLKFGLYSDAGYMTCGRRPGSLGYEKQDAKTYAEWGVDYLKYDNCFNDGSDPRIRYTAMRDALNATGRPIFYSMCEWGQKQPATWAADVGNSWRTTMDIMDIWPSILFNLDHNNVWHKYAGPGGWNDPDMLEVGNGGMSDTEYRAHFSLWALMKSPLIIGCDITNMSAATLETLTNPEVIAVNQDPLGVQGYAVYGVFFKQVWMGPLADGSKAVILFNGLFGKDNITAKWSFLDIPANSKCHVRDLWARKDLGWFVDSFSADVESHGVVMVKITC